MTSHRRRKTRAPSREILVGHTTPHRITPHHLGDTRVRRERGARDRAGAGHDVARAIREARLWRDDVSHLRIRSRHHETVTAERGAILAASAG